METSLKIAFVKCSFCSAKNHCRTCGEELSEALAARPHIQEAEVDTKTHTARILHDLDPEELLDLLEGMGIMEA